MPMVSGKFCQNQLQSNKFLPELLQSSLCSWPISSEERQTFPHCTSLECNLYCLFSHSYFPLPHTNLQIYHSLFKYLWENIREEWACFAQFLLLFLQTDSSARSSFHTCANHMDLWPNLWAESGSSPTPHPIFEVSCVEQNQMVYQAGDLIQSNLSHLNIHWYQWQVSSHTHTSLTEINGTWDVQFTLCEWCSSLGQILVRCIYSWRKVGSARSIT